MSTITPPVPRQKWEDACLSLRCECAYWRSKFEFKKLEAEIMSNKISDLQTQSIEQKNSYDNLKLYCDSQNTRLEKALSNLRFRDRFQRQRRAQTINHLLRDQDAEEEEEGRDTHAQPSFHSVTTPLHVNPSPGPGEPVSLSSTDPIHTSAFPGDMPSEERFGGDPLRQGGEMFRSGPFENFIGTDESEESVDLQDLLTYVDPDLEDGVWRAMKRSVKRMRLALQAIDLGSPLFHSVSFLAIAALGGLLSRPKSPLPFQLSRTSLGFGVDSSLLQD